MANLYSKATGNWTTLGTFNTLANGSGTDTVPLNTHDVVIQSPHSVTLDSTACVAKSCTINSGGTLVASTAASNTLTLENDLIIDGTCTLDVSSDATKVCTIITNNANGSGTGTLPNQNDPAPAPSLGGCVLTRTNTGSVSWKGAVRKRWTTLSAQASSGASSATVSDATGWRQGDIVVLGSTSTTQTAFDLMTLSGSYINGSTSLAFTATLANTHASGGYVINLTSNLIIGPSASGRSGNVAFYNPTTTTTAVSKTLSHVQFNYLKTSSLSVNTSANVPFFISQNDTTDTGWQSFDSCAFNDFTSTGTIGMYLFANATNFTRSNNVFHLPSFGGVSALYVSSGVIVGYFLNAGCLMGTDTDMVVTRTTGPVFCPGISSAYTLIRPKVTGSHTGIFTFKNPGIFTIVDPDMQGGTNFCISEFGQLTITSTTSTSSNIGAKAAWTTMFNQVTTGTTLGGTSYNFSLTDANIQSAGTFLSAGSIPMDDSTTLALVNKNADVTLQEIWKPYGNIKRNNAVKTGSTSSIAMNPTTTGKNLTYTVSVPCASGSSIRIIGACKYDALFYNSGTWNAPTVTISGLGISPQTFTAAGTSAKTCTFSNGSQNISLTSHGFSVGQKKSFATTGSLPTNFATLTEYYVVNIVDANTFQVSATYGGTAITAGSAGSGTQSVLSWQSIDLSATNGSGADGNFTVTFTANASSATTGTVYFDGIPTSSPYVTKARHYGYLFDQLTPNVTTNPSYSASEATANAYTGITVTGGASTSSITVTADQTFQKLYDYTQAWSARTENFGYAVPISAPVAGVLVAAGAITINTTKVVNGSGSIAMGSYLLTTELAGGTAYTYTGGTWSQATTVPSFSGGTMAIGAAGTYTFAMSSGKITATPTSASNYVLSNGTFTGSNLFWNTTAYDITVEIPAGATFSSAGSPGAGTVTFVAPVEYQSVTVTGFTPGSRIYLKDVTSGTVLCNSTTSTTNVVISGSSCVWTDPSAASATRQIALRIAYVSGATAKVFIDNTNIGTCAVSGGGKDVSYIASQSADTTYNSNAVDGSTVTGITFTDAATDLVVCNLAGGSTTWPRIYAAFVYWLSTALGIDDDVTYISAPDTANYLLTAMKIRNANATPLTITSGYGRSATTGLVEDIIDVAGSTGNIYPEPNHVVPYQTTGTYAITGDISTVLTSIGEVPDAVLAAAAVTPIAADIQKVLAKNIAPGSTSTASLGYL